MKVILTVAYMAVLMTCSVLIAAFIVTAFEIWDLDREVRVRECASVTADREFCESMITR